MLAKARTKIIRVLATEPEHAEIKAAAERASLPVAVYVRSAALEKARSAQAVSAAPPWEAPTGLPSRPAIPMGQAMKRRWKRFYEQEAAAREAAAREAAAREAAAREATTTKKKPRS
jgi:hypothetical protein